MADSVERSARGVADTGNLASVGADSEIGDAKEPEQVSIAQPPTTQPRTTGLERARRNDFARTQPHLESRGQADAEIRCVWSVAIRGA